MPVESHILMDGALHVYRRVGSRFWQCSTYLGSRNHRQTTKEESLAAAKDFARDWYMERCVEDRQRRRGGVSLITVPSSLLPPNRARLWMAVVVQSRSAQASRMLPRRLPVSSR